MVLACAAVTVLAAATLLLLAAPTTEPPCRTLLAGASVLLPRPCEEPHAAAAGRSRDDAPSLPPAAASPPPLKAKASLPSKISLAHSMFSVPAPSPAENFDDGSTEEPERPDMKPISCGGPTRSSGVSEYPDKSGNAEPHPKQEIPLWSTAADKELTYAKKEIANAPLVSDDPDLYAPLFRNVSIFKRQGSGLASYSLLKLGPYTTKLHAELRKNTKALCNADLSEGVFIRGRDVSLPETFVRSPRRPLRDIGGKPATERSILAFFVAQMHGRVRPILLKYWGSKDDADMRIYSRIPRQITRQMNYVKHMKSNKYCICPAGCEVNSPRIMEAIYYERVPVIIADNFVLPFDDALDWTAFSVVVPERDVLRLKEILLGIPESRYVAMQANVRKVQRHFLWYAKPVKYNIFHMILHSVWFSRVNHVL